MRNNDDLAERLDRMIVQNMEKLPKDLVLMYLHLRNAGIEMSEVADIKGDGYFINDHTAGVRIFISAENRKKSYPIPLELYFLMVGHMIRERIGKDDYVFKDPTGKRYTEDDVFNRLFDCLFLGKS